MSDRLPSWVYDSPAVWTSPYRLGGTPCVRGTRVPVEAILSMDEGGATPAEIMEYYPSIGRLILMRLLEDLDRNEASNE